MSWCLTVAKTRCVACCTLSRHQVNDEFVAKHDNFISGSRKIFLVVEYCCQLCGASANWITDFSGARLMRSERWHGIGFQIWAFFQALNDPMVEIVECDISGSIHRNLILKISKTTEIQ